MDITKLSSDEVHAFNKRMFNAQAKMRQATFVYDGRKLVICFDFLWDVKAGRFFHLKLEDDERIEGAIYRVSEVSQQTVDGVNSIMYKRVYIEVTNWQVEAFLNSMSSTA